MNITKIKDFVQNKQTQKDMNNSDKILNDITFMVNLEIINMKSKIDNKLAYKKKLEERFLEAKEVYDKIPPRNKKKRAEAYIDLQYKYAELDSFAFISGPDSFKLERFAKIIIEIERNKRDQITFEGITDLSDSELIEKAREILQNAS